MTWVVTLEGEGSTNDKHVLFATERAAEAWMAEIGPLQDTLSLLDQGNQWEGYAHGPYEALTTDQAIEHMNQLAAEWRQAGAHA